MCRISIARSRRSGCCCLVTGRCQRATRRIARDSSCRRTASIACFAQPSRKRARARRGTSCCRSKSGSTVEYVTGKPWSGYNWFKGGARSLIQVNTDLPIFVDRALDLAAHEGYPGHHVYNTLLERHVAGERDWIEASVYALFSPQSLIAEGTANFGIDVAFPGPERVAFEREVLFPLAGLDPDTAEGYAAARALAKALVYAGNEAARDYLDGRIGREAAADLLVRYALMSPAQAEQRVRFFDMYRSYVINYNLGEDLVRAWVERQGGTPDAPDRRWQVFAGLLSGLKLPASLG